jgi:hypothetical protein
MLTLNVSWKYCAHTQGERQGQSRHIFGGEGDAMSAVWARREEARQGRAGRRTISAMLKTTSSTPKDMEAMKVK